MTHINFYIQAITTDIHVEKLESKFKELQNDAKSITENPHDLSLLEQSVEDSDQNQCVQKLRNLRSKILEVEVSRILSWCLISLLVKTKAENSR